MNNEFEKALDTAVRKTGLTHQKAFDALIKIALFDVIEHGLQKTNPQFNFEHVETKFFEPGLSKARYQAIDDVWSPLLSIMAASAPFEDVIGNYYEARFIKKKPTGKEFMDPELVSVLLEKIKNDNDEEPENKAFTDFVCGTGKHTLSFLKQTLEACGKDKLLNRKVYICDNNASKLRIAIYQTMLNCIRSDMRIGQLIAINFDMMKTFEGSDKHWVWWVYAKTGDERIAALKATAEKRALRAKLAEAA